MGGSSLSDTNSMCFPFPGNFLIEKIKGKQNLIFLNLSKIFRFYSKHVLALDIKNTSNYYYLVGM